MGHLGARADKPRGFLHRSKELHVLCKIYTKSRAAQLFKIRILEIYITVSPPQMPMHHASLHLCMNKVSSSFLTKTTLFTVNKI